MQEYTQKISTRQGYEEIAFIQYSAGDHPFIAWHSISSVNRMWYWDPLWPHGQVVLAGLPGHGPVRRYPWSHYAAWTPQHFIDMGVETLRQQAGDRPATLIGHSTGSLVALGVALRAPERVARLILLAPVVWHRLNGIVWSWERLARWPCLQRAWVAASIYPGQRSSSLLRALLRPFITDREAFYSNPRLDETLARSHPHYRQTSTDAIAGTARVLRMANLRPLVQERGLNVPTLLFHGQQDRVVPLAQAEWLAQVAPQVELAALPGAGHMIFVERAGKVMDKLLAWCREHPV